MEQFGQYCSLFYNYRFGETTEAILQAIIRQHRLVDGEDVSGEAIFNQNYEEKQKALLTDLIEKRKTAQKTSEQRLYNVLFHIIREEYDTVHNFIK